MQNNHRKAMQYGIGFCDYFQLDSALIACNMIKITAQSIEEKFNRLPPIGTKRKKFNIFHSKFKFKRAGWLMKRQKKNCVIYYKESKLILKKHFTK